MVVKRVPGVNSGDLGVLASSVISAKSYKPRVP